VLAKSPSSRSFLHPRVHPITTRFTPDVLLFPFSPSFRASHSDVPPIVAGLSCSVLLQGEICPDLCRFHPFSDMFSRTEFGFTRSCSFLFFILLFVFLRFILSFSFYRTTWKRNCPLFRSSILILMVTPAGQLELYHIFPPPPSTWRLTFSHRQAFVQ